jgi:hypothetical protein
MTSTSAYHFQLEEQLQDYCIAVLRQKGVPCSKEMYLNGLRADIVTPDAIIECKKVLTRDAIWQAYGQAREYADRTGKPRVILVGQSPNSEKALNAAMGAADQLKGKAEVSFIETDGYWRLKSRQVAVAPARQQPAPRQYVAASSHLDSGYEIYIFPRCMALIVACGLFAATVGRPSARVVDASNCVEYAGQGGCTATNIRAIPEGAIVDSLQNGTNVVVEKEENGWCKIKRGWAFCEHLR